MRPWHRDAAFLLGALAFALVVLQPALHTPLRFDDTFTFEMRTGMLDLHGRTFGDYVRRSAEDLTANGRFQPTGLLLAVVPWTFSDAPTLYKIYLVLTALLAVGMLSAVLRRLGAPAAPAAAVVVLFAAFAQLRWYHDPLLGYSGIAQWSLVLLAGTLLAWLRWDAGGRRRTLAAALVLWALCVTAYDANLTLLAVVVIVIAVRRRGWRTSARAALPFVLIALATVASSVVARTSADTVAGGYTVSLTPSGLLETWAVTVVGAVPGSYLLFDPDGILADLTKVELLAGLWRGALVAVMVAAAVRRTPAGLWWRPVAAVGLVLWLVPSALLALTPKYRTELVWGDDYLPALLQTAGVATAAIALAAAAVAAARARGRRTGLAVLVAVVSPLALGATLAGATNLRVVAHEQPVRATRSLFNDALRDGILRDLPELATVVVQARDTNWYPTGFATDTFALNAVTVDRTGRRYDMRSDTLLAQPSCGPPPRGSWLRRTCDPAADRGGWLHVRPTRHGGAVVLAIPPAGRVDEPLAEAERLVLYATGDLAQGPTELVGLTSRRAPWSSHGTVRWDVVPLGGGSIRAEGTFVRGAARPAVFSLSVPQPSVDFYAPPAPRETATLLGERQLLP